jgi:hypothetical protein
MKKVKPHAVDWAQIERFLTSADKKLASAHKILAFDEEACLQQAFSRKHGGESTSDNLAYACVICNRSKGADIAAIDQSSGKIARSSICDVTFGAIISRLKVAGL